MRKITILLVCLLLSCAVQVSAQKKSLDALNREIRQAEEDIKRNTALLNETRKDQASGQRELKLTQGRVTSRRRVVSALEQQIGLLDADLNESQSSVGKLNKEQNRLRAEYADMIRESYKNYLLSNYLALLFASKDFDDLTRRIDYMRRYNAMRERKAYQIDSLSGVINTHIAEVDMKLSELDKTKKAHDQELASLAVDVKQYEKTLASLKTQESKISRQIADKRAQIARAQQEIARMVAAENKKSGKATLSAEQLRVATELTGRFDQNKGRLPWPVRGGVIIDPYGLHAHPTQRGITVDNKGVNIAGSKGAEVFCVFEGTVANIFFYQGLNNNVMVRHGSYLTVYSNLSSVSVRVGDKVALNQSLGRLSSSGNSEDYSLHFEVWKESSNLNPEQWLMP